MNIFIFFNAANLFCVHHQIFYHHIHKTLNVNISFIFIDPQMFVIHVMFFFKSFLIWNDFMIILMFSICNLIIFIIFWQLTMIQFIKSRVDFLTNIFLSTSLFMQTVVILTFNVGFNLFVSCDANAHACTLNYASFQQIFFCWCLNFFF